MREKVLHTIFNERKLCKITLENKFFNVLVGQENLKKMELLEKYKLATSNRFKLRLDIFCLYLTDLVLHFYFFGESKGGGQ